MSYLKLLLIIDIDNLFAGDKKIMIFAPQKEWSDVNKT